MNNNYTPLTLPQENTIQEHKKKDTFLVVLMGLSAVLLAVLGTIVALLFTGSYKGPMSASATSAKVTDVVVSAEPSITSKLNPTPTVSLQAEPDILEKQLDSVSLDTDTMPTGLPAEPSLDTLVTE
ncbi:hypothetical protein COU88_01415 [Candidatus Roizmanbacteria bacterium CG10_big_fil_rev_8_21_14_0_10_39_6]|uniref:Uncharacterized protein n=1 Tax=Candidatus Roizmanbacteria bacterium CG10_big_fil_rev_8_21_14_0_10_39_6 TaxID=1974853 RepID=A0A2M8KT40_9BACT|nr:MAG: hypothetical protein COU88_01415 [Candidatus Roizmanbacteria bacterium CG10_big_fil_rev_8_21_14_0_10_39_6]